MRIWLFGTRRFGAVNHEASLPVRSHVRQIVGSLPPTVTVVEGEALGPDRWARIYARDRGLAVERHPVTPLDWARYGRRAGILRNETMASSGVNAAIGWWDGVSAGTKHSTALCEKYGIPYIVYVYDARGRHVDTLKDTPP